jgi:membrane fusion protein (multidrug efflux system)
MNNISAKFKTLALIFSGFVLTLYSCKEKKTEEVTIPEITVVETTQKDVPVFETYVGQVYGYSDIPIRARVQGFLTGIYFREGSKVKKGKLLYTIDPQEYEAKVATQESYLAEAKTKLTKAKSDLDRIEPLAKINAVSKSDLDAARANYQAALSYVNAMESNLKFAKINLGYCWIKAPISGFIGKTNARIGEFVGQNPNPVILNTISTTDTIRVQFFINEADYLRLARKYKNDSIFDKNKKDKSVLRLILADGTIFKYKGLLNFINREVDPQTGSLLIEAVFPNPERLLKPGQYAKVVVQLAEINDALLIPQRCIMELQGQHMVFVVKEDNTVENKIIETGEKIGDMQIVTNGLKPGDKVVIDALQKVKSGMKILPKIIEFKSQSTSQF